jgi:hypothetical protein
MNTRPTPAKPVVGASAKSPSVTGPSSSLRQKRERTASGLLAFLGGADIGDAVAELDDLELTQAYARALARLVVCRDGGER